MRAAGAGIEAAERHFEAGEVGHARALLEEVVAESPPGGLRAHALARLGWVCTHEEGIRAGADVFFAALAEPTDDVRLRIEILQGLSWCLHSSRSVSAAMEHAQGGARAGRGARRHDRARRRARARRLPRIGRRRRLATARIERALALEYSPPWSQVLGRPGLDPRLLLVWSGRLEAARDRFESLLREALESGDEHSLPFVLFPLRAARAADGRLGGRAAPRARVLRGERAQRPGRRAALRDHDRGAAGRAPRPRGSARARIDEGIELAKRIGVHPARLRAAGGARLPRALPRGRRRRRAARSTGSPS